MKQVKIYSLCDTGGPIRYIGKTTQTLEGRLYGHFSEARGRGQTHKLNWLRAAQHPTIQLIEEVPADIWQMREKYWVALAREYCCNLVNGTDGGDAVPLFPGKHPQLGKPRLLSTRKAISRTLTGRKRSAEHRANLSKALSGRIPSAACMKACREAKLGSRLTLASRKAIGQSLKKYHRCWRRKS